MRVLTHIILLLFCLTLKAQEHRSENLQFDFSLLLNERNLIEEDYIYSYDNKGVSVGDFKCYLSAIKLLYKGHLVWEESDSFHLLDMKNPESFQFNCKDMPEELQYDALEFQLGIDSLTNVSGAMGGDLDPTKGMYWSWQSGYINFKLEGTHENSPARKNEFQLHLGGYMMPYATVQKIHIPTKKKNKIEIVIDLTDFFSSIAIETDYKVMSPGEKAVYMSKIAARCFYEK